MNIEKALDRIRWRFSNGKAFMPNVNDVEAFNYLVDYVEQKEAQTLRDNALFAKLYIWVYGQFLSHYKATVFDSIPQKELNKLLDLPLADHVKRFTDSLNDSELYSIFDLTDEPDLMSVHIEHLRSVLEAQGIDSARIDKRIAQIEFDREQWRGRLQEYLKKNPAIEAALYRGQKPWAYEDVTVQLNAMITKAITNFGNE